MNTQSHKDFICGFACALVTINDGYDQPSMCANVIKSAGFTKEDFKCVSGYDKQKLKVILKELKD